MAARLHTCCTCSRAFAMLLAVAIAWCHSCSASTALPHFNSTGTTRQGHNRGACCTPALLLCNLHSAAAEAKMMRVDPYRVTVAGGKGGQASTCSRAGLFFCPQCRNGHCCCLCPRSPEQRTRAQTPPARQSWGSATSASSVHCRTLY